MRLRPCPGHEEPGLGELVEHCRREPTKLRLGRLIDAPPPSADAERFAGHLADEFPAVFLFLYDPSVDAENRRAEQAVRPALVTRKVCGGNRTRRGADTQQVPAGVVRTARQRGPDPGPLITAMLCAPGLVAPEALALPRSGAGTARSAAPASSTGWSRGAVGRSATS